MEEEEEGLDPGLIAEEEVGCLAAEVVVAVLA